MVMKKKTVKLHRLAVIVNRGIILVSEKNGKVLTANNLKIFKQSYLFIIKMSKLPFVKINAR